MLTAELWSKVADTLVDSIEGMCNADNDLRSKDIAVGDILRWYETLLDIGESFGIVD